MIASEQTGRQVETIAFDDFLKMELWVGRIVSGSVFAEARKPAYILHVDFGDELGIKNRVLRWRRYTSQRSSSAN